MKAFTVTWHPEAEDELAKIWIAYGHRKRVTLAVATIDNALANDPESQGERVREDLRSLNVPPLRVLFAVRPEDRLAEVLKVSVISATGA
jgi:hypothetical protein